MSFKGTPKENEYRCGMSMSTLDAMLKASDTVGRIGDVKMLGEKLGDVPMTVSEVSAVVAQTEMITQKLVDVVRMLGVHTVDYQTFDFLDASKWMAPTPYQGLPVQSPMANRIQDNNQKLDDIVEHINQLIYSIAK